ncbi:MAG TPA: hypothetical protein DCL41_07765 [Bdellovibrionales bacterium]|nr:hypothetical protein [Pseudobdellovibrionaceae bacterium]HAG91752.1 hypothetical protein [Bdellovibrionales bacterium]|tara:strand:+ start:284 stop:685 length:402 start_codon:yes stop_codon:yes gene_type:complete
MARWIYTIAAVILVSTSSWSWAQTPTTTYQPADPGKEFIMSCTYGVLAGTLIGAATLAFVDKPSENLNKVARGASIGLYVGILLGAYVVYVVPSMEPDPYDSPLVSQNWGLAPILSDEGSLDGAQVQMQLLSF